MLLFEAPAPRGHRLLQLNITVRVYNSFWSNFFRYILKAGSRRNNLTVRYTLMQLNRWKHLPSSKVTMVGGVSIS